MATAHKIYVIKETEIGGSQRKENHTTRFFFVMRSISTAELLLTVLTRLNCYTRKNARIYWCISPCCSLSLYSGWINNGGAAVVLRQFLGEGYPRNIYSQRNFTPGRSHWCAFYVCSYVSYIKLSICCKSRLLQSLALYLRILFSKKIRWLDCLVLRQYSIISQTSWTN